MPIYDYFKNLFGFSSNRSENNNREDHNYRDYFWGNNPSTDSFEGVWSESDPQESPNEGGIHFNIFSDPLEMHRYFEYQMHEMLKSFGGFIGGHNDGSFFGFNNPVPGQPSIEEQPGFQPRPGNLRDQFLKPGYGNPRHFESSDKPKLDSDVDGKVNSTDLDALLDENQSRAIVPSPYQGSLLPKVRTFGKSMTSKTIRGSDGTIETHQTVRDNAGNEETTITRQMGDKRYTVTIRTDKDGRQEKTEDIVNIDEQELSRFTNSWQNRTSPKIQDAPDVNKWFPYDKFFK